MADAELHLAESTVLVQTWKPSKTRNVGCAIVRALLSCKTHELYLYADEVDLSFVENADAKIIGLAWRNLRRNKIIKRLDITRRSTKKSSHGREIHAYAIESVALAIAFLKANGEKYKPQPELF